MQNRFINHNRFIISLSEFYHSDPHLFTLSQLEYQYEYLWWQDISFETPGIYMLTGGRQVGKSTSCKQLIKHCLKKKIFTPQQIFYLQCDEVYDAKELSQIIRLYLKEIASDRFLLIIDEVTFVENWDRVIKGLADEGYFRNGFCLLTGSDSLILKEAAMRFPGRRGRAAKTDFHLYPLSFREFVQLKTTKNKVDIKVLEALFQEYLQCGGYLRAINDLAEYGEITEATLTTYEQWIRGDFLKRGKSEESLLSILRALLNVGVSQISYNKLTQKIGSITRETLSGYLELLERMDILINLQAFDQNTKLGFPRKDRKFHFCDPFIYNTIENWLVREGYMHAQDNQPAMVEACVASHCHRFGRTYYSKGQGEIDVILVDNKIVRAIEVKWSEQIRSTDLKMLKAFRHAIILTKLPLIGKIENIESIPVYVYLNSLEILRREDVVS